MHRTRTQQLALCALGLLAACEPDAPARVESPSSAAAGTIPFEMAGPGGAAIVVPVHVNGAGPYEFVLDTGATLTCVDEAVADSLGLSEAVGPVGFGTGVGGAGRLRLVSVDSLRVGGAQAFALTACALDLAQFEQAGLHADGLLGLNFLRAFRVTLDFEARTLHLDGG